MFSVFNEHMKYSDVLYSLWSDDLKTQFLKKWSDIVFAQSISTGSVLVIVLLHIWIWKETCSIEHHYCYLGSPLPSSACQQQQCPISLFNAGICIDFSGYLEAQTAAVAVNVTLLAEMSSIVQNNIS